MTTVTSAPPETGGLLAGLADLWRAAKSRERVAMADLTQAIRRATGQGMTEAQIVRATGVNRMTVRKAMGH